MVEAGTISTCGIQPDAKVIDEFVFDVNTEIPPALTGVTVMNTQGHFCGSIPPGSQGCQRRTVHFIVSSCMYQAV